MHTNVTTAELLCREDAIITTDENVAPCLEGRSRITAPPTRPFVLVFTRTQLHIPAHNTTAVITAAFSAAAAAPPSAPWAAAAASAFRCVLAYATAPKQLGDDAHASGTEPTGAPARPQQAWHAFEVYAPFKMPEGGALGVELEVFALFKILVSI